MKRILLLSDTHGHLDTAMEKYIREADEVWHAGDIGSLTLSDRIAAIKPMQAVYGNIDGHDVREVWPEHSLYTTEGVTVLMLHIAGTPDRYNARARTLIQMHRPQLFVCGHSHILKITRDTESGLLHINPGAAGHHGFHHERTMVRFTLHEGKIDEVDVITLGTRGQSTKPVS